MRRINLFLAFCCLLTVQAQAHSQRTVVIESNVPGANVFADWIWIGIASQSPFTINENVKTISIRQVSFDEWSIAPIVFDLKKENELDSESVLTLKAIFPVVEDNTLKPVVLVGLGSELKRRNWISFAAAGTSILAGALAIHLRTKADNRFETYLKTGNPTLKTTVKRLDLQSGMALGVMQVGVGIIAFRLIF